MLLLRFVSLVWQVLCHTPLVALLYYYYYLFFFVRGLRVSPDNAVLLRFLSPLFGARRSGMYLTDLTFIEDGNPDKVGHMINFVKRRLYANVIREIQQYQVGRICLLACLTKCKRKQGGGGWKAERVESICRRDRLA